MSQLLEEVLGWLGYLQRPAVLVQLLAVLAVLVAVPLLRRARGRPPGPPGSGPAVSLSALALLVALLALSGQPWGLALTLLALLAGWEALGLLRRGLCRLIQPNQVQLLDTRLIRPGYLLFAVLVLVRQVDSPFDLSLIPLGSWFGSQVRLGDLLGSLLIVYLLAMGTGPPAEGLAWLVHRSIGISHGSRRALGLMIRYLVVGIGIVWALDHIGFNRGAILAVAGGLSVGLGFGIKEVFSNFVSGIWLLFEGSVRPGEVLFIDGDPCEVRSLGLRAAVLWRDRDNAELVIPNQTFFTATTTTYTGSDRMRRSQVLVSAAYRHDPAVVIALLESTTAANARVLAEPRPKGLLLSYGDSAINYAVRFFIANPLENTGICSEVQTAVWHAFREHGIEIPFPQQVQYQVEAAPEEPVQGSGAPPDPSGGSPAPRQ